MGQKLHRPISTSEPSPAAARPTWQLPGGSTNPRPRGQYSRWLLAAAIIFQVAWVAALIGMAMFVHWKK